MARPTKTIKPIRRFSDAPALGPRVAEQPFKRGFTSKAREIMENHRRLDETDIIDTLEEQDEFPTYAETYNVSFVEFAMINSYLNGLYRKPNGVLAVSYYGYTDNLGRVNFGGSFDVTESLWYMAKFNDDPNDYFFHTKSFQDQSQAVITQLHISIKGGSSTVELEKVFKRLKSLAFNNSIYTGKCIKVKVHDSTFMGIEIIDIPAAKFELILNPTQAKYVESFITRVARGSSARYLLNGEPGTGKTETIRDIIRKLMPQVTFIMPSFDDEDDLSTILEACEIFDKAVIIMDDIDLFLGSREKGVYTKVLGDFLAFFDGVKKRKISLIASTNDKGLVDKAAERPGRFNLTLDYTFLNNEQIVKLCKIYLPEEYQLDSVYDALCENIDGKKSTITGAFISNLAENIKEMAEDDKKWSVEDTIELIIESYKGFYSSQNERQKSMGFKTQN